MRLPIVIEKLFPAASRIVREIMERGTHTHLGDWRTLPAGFHLARAQRHLDLLAGGDMGEPHLAHAACRLLMELEVAICAPTIGMKKLAIPRRRFSRRR
jgi:hypothetical protein